MKYQLKNGVQVDEVIVAGSSFGAAPGDRFLTSPRGRHVHFKKDDFLELFEPASALEPLEGYVVFAGRSEDGHRGGGACGEKCYASFHVLPSQVEEFRQKMVEVHPTFAGARFLAACSMPWTMPSRSTGT